MKYLTTMMAAASMALCLTPATAPAQEQQQGQRERGRFNPDEFRKMMEDRMKAAMKTTDEEWTVLQPMIEKVSEKSRELSAYRYSGFGRGDRGGSPGGGGPGGSSRTPPAEATALKESLEKEAGPDELKARLDAMRARRKQAQADVDAARDQLKKVVTVRQEAVLVAMGILE